MKSLLLILLLSLTLPSISQYIHAQDAAINPDHNSHELISPANETHPNSSTKTEQNRKPYNLKNNITTNPDPQYFGYTKKKTFGNIGGKIFFKPPVYDAEWQYLFTIPVEENPNLKIDGENKIVYLRSDDSLFYYDLKGKEIKRESRETMINNFFKAPITEVKFSQGISGCFSRYSNELSYTYHAGDFDNPVESLRGSKYRDVMPLNDDAIAGTAVDEFLKNVRILFNKSGFPLTSIDDFGFIEKDYARCRTYILEFQKYQKSSDYQRSPFDLEDKNIDFDRFLRLVDSIKTIDIKQFQVIMEPSAVFISTTRRWKSVDFTNNRNEKLSISNVYFDKELPLSWRITLNNITITSNWYGITKFLKEVYPDFLPPSDKSLLLFDFVKNLYRSGRSS